MSELIPFPGVAAVDSGSDRVSGWAWRHEFLIENFCHGGIEKFIKSDIFKCGWNFFRGRTFFDFCLQFGEGTAGTFNKLIRDCQCSFAMPEYFGYRNTGKTDIFYLTVRGADI